jgi:uncharacterized membrane protein
VAAIFAGIAITALAIATFFAINIGQLYYAQRQLENYATMAALAGAQQMSGCRSFPAGTPVLAVASIQSGAVTPSLANSLSNDGSSLSASDLLAGAGQTPAVQLGRMTLDTTTGIRSFTPLPDQSIDIDSVRVTLGRNMPTFFGAWFSGTSGTLKASATASQFPVGSFMVRSGTLKLDTSTSPLLNPLLSGLLGTSVSLSALDYQNLVSAQVDLGKLMIAANVHNLNDLLALQTSLPGALQIVGNALTLAGDVVSQTAGGLISGLGGMAYNPPGSSGVVFGHLFNGLGNALSPIPLGVTQAAMPLVDAYDLLLALAEDASQDQPINLTLGLGPLLSSTVADVHVFLQIGQPSTSGLGSGRAGYASASTAEIKLLVRIEAGKLISAVTGLVNGLLNGILSLVEGLLKLVTIGAVNVDHTLNILPALKLGVDVLVAPAYARLDSLQCPTLASGPGARLSVKPGIAAVQVGSYAGSLPSRVTSIDQIPPIDPSATVLDVLDLGLTATVGGTDLGALNLDVVLNFTCVGVGGVKGTECDVPASGFVSLNQVDQFDHVASSAPPVYKARGFPPADPVSDNPQSRGAPVQVSLALGLDVNNDGSHGVLGLLGYVLAALVDALKALIQLLLDLVNGLATLLINPLLSLLGIQLGTATVFMDAVTMPPPVIVSNALPSAPASAP